MSFKVAVAGLGVVGSGVVRLLTEQKEILRQRCNKAVELTAVADINEERFRALDLPESVTYYKNAMEMLEKSDADVFVELIGGAEGFALDFCRAVLDKSKNFVTANKAMLAHHGNELGALAEEKGVFFGYEAAVAGGIPVIKTLREGFVGNSVTEIYGILNGTCNYILTTMRETGRSFEDVLSEAQDLGYAEKPDPSLDVDGLDTAHKMCILGSLAFGMPMDLRTMSIEGIRRISAMDIAYADELGYRIKLLGIGRASADGVSLNVYPCMVAKNSSIAPVDGVFNAVIVEGNFVGHAMTVGRGAGERPTASAVVSDIVDAAMHRGLPLLTKPMKEIRPVAVVPLSEREGEYYLRFDVRDRAGVIAEIAKILGEEGVSIATIIQRGKTEKGVPLIMTLHTSKESAVAEALDRIELLDSVLSKPCMIRIERF